MRLHDVYKRQIDDNFLNFKIEKRGERNKNKFLTKIDAISCGL